MQNIGPTEIIIIGLILILLFGAKKVAELGKSAGEATKQIRKIKEEVAKPLEDKGDNDTGEEVEES